MLPLGLCLGAQLDWQERTFPEAFARATDILPLPQYWAWRLSGVKATEVTSLGAHTHLWRPARGAVLRPGAAPRLGRALPADAARLGHAGHGPPELAGATGLPPDCRVLAGIHDSNASYLPHLVARAPPFTVLSTGTWIIAMAPGLPLAGWTPHADMLANVDARGEPVPTARFMGGREVELVAGAEALRRRRHAPTSPPSSRAGVMALPSFVAGSGPFIGRRADHGRCRAAPGAARRWPRSMPR